MAAASEESASGPSTSKVKKELTWNKKLDEMQVADMIVKKKIKTSKGLWAEASGRKEQGECDLALFMMKRSRKFIAELVQKAWEMENAAKDLTESAKTRMERMEEALEAECAVPNCMWLNSAKEILTLTNIDHIEFKEAMLCAIRDGRKKFNNIILVGRSNCGKTFLLKPLREIFKERLFEKPANDKYGWLGVEDAQVICLQDFRYSKDLICWSDFLLLLEGESVKLPAPKNQCTEDIKIPASNDIPIFATGPSKIHVSYLRADATVENEMMDSRWRVFTLTHVFAQSEQREIPTCKRCFAELVLS